MRITNNTLTGNYLRNLNKNLENMQLYQNQLSTGKEISKPSDDPMRVSRVMNLSNAVKQNEQFSKNIDDSLGWVQTADGALNSLSDTMLRARDLLIYGASGTLSDTDRSALADEFETLISEAEQLLNTNFDGRYIFGGQETTQPPFSLGTDGNGNPLLEYGGDNNNLRREVANGVSVEIIADGSRLTTAADTTPGNDDLGAFMANTLQALKDGDMEALSGDLIGDMDRHVDNVIRVRSKIGATHNRLEAAQERNTAENLNSNTLLSKAEDIDFAEKMMEFSTMLSVYQASLKAGARVLQPSLLDYIR